MPASAPLPPLAGTALLDEAARRAFTYFREHADPKTGLVNDRASNFGKDSHVIASLAATGYGLAALPIGVERGWVSRTEARQQARQTLNFLLHDLPHQHGWMHHFVDRRTGERVWKSEVSSIDTTLCVLGALVCGQYFAGTDLQVSAEQVYTRLDWTWMRTRGGKEPDSLLVCHGWKPESGFLKPNWDTYSEGILLYLLGLGAARDPLPAACWTAWRRDVVAYGGWETLTGGPLFLHQMPHGFFDLRNRRDALGWDYHVSAANAIRMNRQYCMDRAKKRRGYGPNGWGLNASDGPRGYKAYTGPGSVGAREDGTLSPPAVLAAASLTPDLTTPAADALYRTYGSRLWGHYGFADAFNADQNWFDEDVIGIDLGMTLLALENARSGLIWRLLKSHRLTARAYAAANLRVTREREPRPLRRTP